MSARKGRIYIQEVAPRDGLQNEAAFVETVDKIALINALSECGFTKIESTSFTSPRAIPALRDADAVMHEIKRKPGLASSALVPNLRGVERGLAANVDEISFVLSVSGTHNRSNLRMSREQSLPELDAIASVLKGSEVSLNVSLSTAFGCPMEGDIDASEVDRLVDQVAALDANGVTLCDTTGMAYPVQVANIGAEVLRRYPELTTTMHFHDTRGMALANVLAALDVGIVHFDSSLGGLGGCPYAPGASGNACTEDLVHMLELMGYDTGIDLEKTVDLSRTLEPLIGRELPSYLVKAGPRWKLHPV